MPYIKNEERLLFNAELDQLSNLIDTPGELNYVITKLIHNRLLNLGLSYTSLNEVIGVLECAKASLVETVVIPYERKKLRENGSVSALDNDSHERMR